MGKQFKKEARVSVGKSASKGKREVLYQNIAGRWYAFTDVGGEIFFGPIDEIKLSESEKREFEALHVPEDMQAA